MSRDKKDLHNELVSAYDKACDEFKHLYPGLPQPFISCTYRTNDEQNALYSQGRTMPGKKVTNAQAGQSPHNFKPSFAFDIAFIALNNKLDWASDLFQKFANIITAQSKNVIWGYDWNGNKIKDKNDFDRPHFELSAWKTFKDIKHL